ncbi:transcription factor TFIID (or TATA-binding protein, TBP) domain-containing protein [Ditylenchus destructor]|uniref:Transcription factor TFIID (Or TATA-binding protein, TBP) domain-containing protein n=1 Tax=Ditylenchus destructor TaxID=166010 RepID=A0AAD4MWC7_9BILA|nr:transcription factor TFIID (or TATA-binding protein, TBP) domain-containing protein [Ditylenchus destructor]
MDAYKFRLAHMKRVALLHLYMIRKSLALVEEYTVSFPITLVPISFKMNQNASDKLLHEQNNLSEKQAKNTFGRNMEITDLNSNIQYIVSSVNVAHKFNLGAFATATKSIYVPELFPGSTQKKNGVTILVFKSGKLVITGAKDIEAISRTFPI